MGTIYKIQSRDGTRCYFGSTTKSGLCRFQKHKWYYENGIRKFTSYMVFEHDPTCTVEEIETVEGSLQQLHQREAWWIRSNECVNKQIPLRSRKEYYQDNKDAMRASTKQWISTHRQEYLSNLRKWREDHPNYMKEWRAKKKALLDGRRDLPVYGPMVTESTV